MGSYRVCGNRAVLGHRPGETFEADLSDIQEQRLIKGGHIESTDAWFDAPVADDPVSEELPDDRAGEPEQEKE